MPRTWDERNTLTHKGRHGEYLSKRGVEVASPCPGFLAPVGRFLDATHRPEHSYMLQCNVCLRFVGMFKGEVLFDVPLPGSVALTTESEVSGGDV